MESTPSKKRECKFYDSFPNNRIRERMGYIGLKSNNLSDKINELLTDDKKITAEAVRQWGSGYTRPDMTLLPIVADALECSTDYLLGRDERPTFDDSFIGLQTGLSDEAIKVLKTMWSENMRATEEARVKALNIILTSDFGLQFLSQLHSYVMGDFATVTLIAAHKEHSKDSFCVDIDDPGFVIDLFESREDAHHLYDKNEFLSMLRDSRMAKMQETIIKIRDEYDSITEKPNAEGIKDGKH